MQNLKFLWDQKLNKKNPSKVVYYVVELIKPSLEETLRKCIDCTDVRKLTFKFDVPHQMVTETLDKTKEYILSHKSDYPQIANSLCSVQDGVDNPEIPELSEMVVFTIREAIRRCLFQAGFDSNTDRIQIFAAWSIEKAFVYEITIVI